MQRCAKKSIIISLLATGCGSNAVQNVQSLGEDQAGKRMARFPVSFQVQGGRGGGQMGLDEASVTFEGLISGCASGFRQVVTDKSTDVTLLQNDVGCEFRLTSMQMNSELFSFSPTIQWKVGQTFDVKGSADTLMQFEVVATLSSKITTAQSVAISFGTPVEQPKMEPAQIIPGQISIAGEEPLRLRVETSELSDILGTGIGLFKVSLQCEVPVVVVNGVSQCGLRSLSSLRASLIADASPTERLSLSGCRQAAAARPVMGAVVNSSPSGNGGILFSNISSPSVLKSAPRLLFAVSDGGNSGGCLYFRIQVPSLF